MPRKSEIQSLVFLLDDPDPDIRDAVKKRLFELGEQAVPLLDEQKNDAQSDGERDLINEIMQSITYGSVEEDFLDILQQGITNRKQLEEAVFVLSRLENPTLRVSEYKRQLDRLADTIRPDIQFQPDETKQMHALIGFVFEELGFSGSTTDYYNPQNSFMDRVMDRRKGIPLSLAFVVLFLARRLELPFEGINMPAHFMLKFEGKKEEVFLDPYDRGTAVSYNQCYYFLKQNGIEPKSEHFDPASDLQMLARYLRNLMQGYQRLENQQKADAIKQLLGALEIPYL